MPQFKSDKEQEEYLFKIVYRICEWLGKKEDTTDEEISDLVMQELINF